MFFHANSEIQNLNVEKSLRRTNVKHILYKLFNRPIRCNRLKTPSSRSFQTVTEMVFLLFLITIIVTCIRLGSFILANLTYRQHFLDLSFFQRFSNSINGIYFSEKYSKFLPYKYGRRFRLSQKQFRDRDDLGRFSKWRFYDWLILIGVECHLVRIILKTFLRNIFR